MKREEITIIRILLETQNEYLKLIALTLGSIAEQPRQWPQEQQVPPSKK